MMSLPMHFHSRFISILLAFSLVLSNVVSFSVKSVAAKAKDNQVTLASYELIGTTSIPTGTQFEDTEIGGLSSITYDANRGVY